MKRKERHVSAFALCVMLLLCSGIKGSAFSLIGPINAIVADNAPQPGAPQSGYYTWPEQGFNFNPAIQPPPNGQRHQGYLNHYDPMGWPVPIKQFYRWNYPELWYSFDAKFIRYFGFEGVQAVHNAVEVLNDY